MEDGDFVSDEEIIEMLDGVPRFEDFSVTLLQDEESGDIICVAVLANADDAPIAFAALSPDDLRGIARTISEALDSVC